MKTERNKQPEPQGTLFVTPLEEVLPSSMLPYAEFVILDRALPRVEDGPFSAVSFIPCMRWG